MAIGSGQSPSQGESVTKCSTRWKVTRPHVCHIYVLLLFLVHIWRAFVRFVYLRQLLQPQLHPLQDRVGVTDGRFGVIPLVFESAANTTCITTQTQRGVGSRYFLSHFWMCLVLLPQFTLSHDSTVFNRAMIIQFMHIHTVFLECVLKNKNVPDFDSSYYFFILDKRNTTALLTLNAVPFDRVKIICKNSVLIHQQCFSTDAFAIYSTKYPKREKKRPQVIMKLILKWLV